MILLYDSWWEGDSDVFITAEGAVFCSSLPRLVQVTYSFKNTEDNCGWLYCWKRWAGNRQCWPLRVHLDVQKHHIATLRPPPHVHYIICLFPWSTQIVVYWLLSDGIPHLHTLVRRALSCGVESCLGTWGGGLNDSYYNGVLCWPKLTNNPQMKTFGQSDPRAS